MPVKKVAVVATPRWQVTAIGSHKSPKFQHPHQAVTAALELLKLGAESIISFGGVGKPLTEVRQRGGWRHFIVFDAATRNAEWYHVERGLLDAGLTKESSAAQLDA